MKRFFIWILERLGIVSKKEDKEQAVDAQEDTPAYTITHVGSNEVRWSGPDLPWKAGGSPVSSACAEAHLYRADNSGGKFDWLRPNSKQRDFKNIRSGYGVWGAVGIPKSGEAVTLVAVNRRDATDRITIGTFEWK